MTKALTLAIGVDGGASGVRALAVRSRSDGRLEPASEVARLEHEHWGGRTLAIQQAEAAAPRLDPEESAAAGRRRAATAEAIARVAGSERRISLGICWPGIKTADGRGIAVMRHGPRDPGFLEALERELVARGIEVARPIPRLAGDGVAGAIGERWSAHGGLHGVRDALYFAGGSGLAESVVVAGRVLALEEFTPPLPKAYELSVPRDESILAETEPARFEDVLAPGRWAGGLAGPRVEGGVGSSAARIDWTAEFQRDPRRAERVLRMVSHGLVRYIEDRMRRLRYHAGIVPERALVGARLGLLLGRPELSAFLRDPVRDGLERLGLAPDFVRASTLLEAPCFGAAALALGLPGEPCPS